MGLSGAPRDAFGVPTAGEPVDCAIDTKARTDRAGHLPITS